MHVLEQDFLSFYPQLVSLSTLVTEHGLPLPFSLNSSSLFATSRPLHVLVLIFIMLFLYQKLVPFCFLGSQLKDHLLRAVLPYQLPKVFAPPLTQQSCPCFLFIL